jgi:hypothetical protein
LATRNLSDVPAGRRWSGMAPGRASIVFHHPDERETVRQWDAGSSL